MKITNRHRLQPPVGVPCYNGTRENYRLFNMMRVPSSFMHNHPSGDPSPSQADIQMRKAIIDIAKPLVIAVHDHIIVGRSGHASLKGLKLI